jgi:serine O-acetyltransferase
VVANILVKLLGGPWNIKDRWTKTKNPRIRNRLSFLSDQYFAQLGSWIGIRAQIKNIPIFPHGIYGIFISNYAKIGSNCVIFQQVTIGSNTLLDSKNIGAPTIGDNCYLGAGCKVIGNVVIGDNVRIGANCVVVTDIPDNCTVVSQPARIIQKDRVLQNHFYTKRGDKWGYLDGENFVEETDADKLRATALQEVARRQLTVKAAGERGLVVSDAELQQASDAWRAVNGLFNASDTGNWLGKSGLTMDKYEAYLEDNLLIFKFKQALASEAKLEKIFTDPQLKDAAIELLYADWLAGAVK